MDNSKKVVKKEYLNEEELEKIINFYVSDSGTKDDIMQELTFVFDKVMWYSMYWNPVSKLWGISEHSKKGWSKYTVHTNKEIQGIIEGYKEYIKNIYSIQHRTISGLKIYYNKLQLS